MDKITRIEISFPVPVELPDGFERVLQSLTSMVCDRYEREHPDRVMWPAGIGSKPQWSKRDAAFLGQSADQDAPESGEPSFDHSVLAIECAEREDHGGSNPHNPNREALIEASIKARKEARLKTKWEEP